MKRKAFAALAVTMSLSCTAVMSPMVGEPVVVNAAETSSESVITDQETIKLVQSLLNCMGYDCGTPDGIAGNNTKNAIMEYQKLKGKDATGNVTTDLLADLYSDIELVVDYGTGTYSDVIDTLYNNNDNCSSAAQQAANGAYRIADMLAIITKGVDKSKKYNSDIKNIQINQMLNDSLCTSAPQQEVNGLYRTVELLGIWAKELDTYSIYASNIDDVLSSLDENNKSSSGAPQQAVNGAYRAVELLNIIAYLLDTNSTYSSYISNIITSCSDNNSTSTSAVQQEVNGLYTCVKLLDIIAIELDSRGKYSTQIDSVIDSFSDVNDSCSSAPQQIANGSYRMTEILAIIAAIYDL